MIKDIKHIIFDLGNVILNINPQLSYQALAQLGIPNFEQFYVQLQKEQVFEKLETNELNSEQFVEKVISTSGVSLPKEAIINAWNALLLDFPLRRLQILQQLQLYYDLVLLSNTNAIHEAYFNQRLQADHGIPNIGVFFDRVYYSHKVGLRKPNPAIFKLVLDECGFVPNHTLFIDDLKINTDTASSLGINTIWLEKGMSIEKDIFLPHLIN